MCVHVTSLYDLYISEIWFDIFQLAIPVDPSFYWFFDTCPQLQAN